MKWTVAAGLVALLLLPQAVSAAGTMNNVTQDINVGGAQITITRSATGGEKIALFGMAKDEKKSGHVTIGKIANEGGHVRNVNQDLNLRNAKISADGGIKINRSN